MLGLDTERTENPGPESDEGRPRPASGLALPSQRWGVWVGVGQEDPTSLLPEPGLLLRLVAWPAATEAAGRCPRAPPWVSGVFPRTGLPDRSALARWLAIAPEWLVTSVSWVLGAEGDGSSLPPGTDQCAVRRGRLIRAGAVGRGVGPQQGIWPSPHRPERDLPGEGAREDGLKLKAPPLP